MYKVEIIYHQQRSRRPLWVLELMATYGRFDEYDDKYSVVCKISNFVEYARNFRYKRRNSTQVLGVTHKFSWEANNECLTISTFYDNPVITLKAVKVK